MIWLVVVVTGFSVGLLIGNQIARWEKHRRRIRRVAAWFEARR